MSAEGIEPSTNGLKGRCSAIELRARDLESEGHSNTGESERQHFLPLSTPSALRKAF